MKMRLEHFPEELMRRVVLRGFKYDLYGNDILETKVIKSFFNRKFPSLAYCYKFYDTNDYSNCTQEITVWIKHELKFESESTKDFT